MKKGEQGKVKTPGRPTSLIVTMAKQPRENISKVRWGILTLFMIPYSEHDKHDVKLVKDQPHHEFVLNGHTALEDLGLIRQGNLTVVISFKDPPPSSSMCMLLLPIQDFRQPKMPKLSFLFL